MKNDFNLFPGKSMSSLFQDIYTNQNQKKRKISDLINDVKVLIKTPDDTVRMGILLSELLNTSVKNDEHLLKLAQIAQKIMVSDNKNEGDTAFLTMAEKEQLLKDMAATDEDVQQLTDDIQKLKDNIA